MDGNGISIQSFGPNYTNLILFSIHVLIVVTCESWPWSKFKREFRRFQYFFFIHKRWQMLVWYDVCHAIKLWFAQSRNFGAVLSHQRVVLWLFILVNSMYIILWAIHGRLELQSLSLADTCYGKGTMWMPVFGFILFTARADSVPFDFK